MRRWNRMVAGVLAIFLIGSVVITACNAKNEENEAKQESPPQGQTFKPFSTTSKKVVAEYKGGKITEGDLHLYMNIYSFLDPQFAMIVSDPSLKEKSNEMKTQLAQELAGQLYIADKLGGEEKYRKQADQTMVEIEKQLKAAPPADGGNPPKNLDEAIKGKGFTKDQLRNFFIRTSQLNSYFEQKLKDKQFDYVKVNHILVAVNEGEAQPGQPKRTDAEAKKRADEVKKKLETGGDFAKLAKEYSDDPGSKDKGGLIEGSLEEGFFVPQFTNAAKTLPLGKISDPVKTDYGYHVMKVIERKKQAIDKAPEDVKQELKNRRSTEIFEQLVKNELQFKSFLPAPKPEKK